MVTVRYHSAAVGLFTDFDREARIARTDGMRLEHGMGWDDGEIDK